MTIKKLVIDVLIPHQPGEIAYAERISELEGTEGITVHVIEVDEKTKTLEMTIEGEALSFENIKNAIEELGGSIHSVDRVSAGSRIINSREKDEVEG
jgi:hypothetical protein